MPLDVESLVRALAGEGDVEGMLVIGLDARRQLCGVGVNPHHRALSFVKVWELEALLRELEACSLVVGLFPSGPTPRTHGARGGGVRRAQHPRGPAQVVLSDCLVARGGRTWSLRELRTLVEIMTTSRRLVRRGAP